MLLDRPATRPQAAAHRRAPAPRGNGAAHERAIRARGRGTARRLLAAGLAEFGERGFQAVTVDDILRRAKSSHGTFYLYFANKDELFAVLANEALQAMDSVTDAFPVVTPDGAGRPASGNGSAPSATPTRLTPR